MPVAQIMRKHGISQATITTEVEVRRCQRRRLSAKRARDRDAKLKRTYANSRLRTPRSRSLTRTLTPTAGAGIRIMFEDMGCPWFDVLPRNLGSLKLE